MTAPLPVFLLSFNRGAYLERVIGGYRRQSIPTDIVIHDFGSDDPATLSAIAAAEEHGVTVKRDMKISHPDELDRVDATVQDYFRHRPPTPYAVSDCDVDLGDAHRDSLDLYRRLLERLPKVQCAGPMLRIADIPRHYPLYNHVMNRHCDQFWSREPSWLDLDDGRIAYLEAPIDTTLAVHRAGEPFRRMKAGVRVYHPYEAAHLDWYQSETDVRNSPYARSASLNVAHWSGAGNQARFGAEPLRHGEAIVVGRDPQGKLVRRIWKVGDTP